MRLLLRSHTDINMLTLFPALVLFHERHLKDKKSRTTTWCAGGPVALWRALTGKLFACCGDSWPRYEYLASFDLSVWFREQYSPWLYKFRYVVLAGFGVMWLVFLVFAALVKAAPFQIYTLFPTGTNSFDFWNGTRRPGSSLSRASSCDM